jgi:phospholipid/cholesterol/gamma-HCH transport system substrate-binding protein
MENKSHALMAGLFVIALSVALALAALWFDRDTTDRVPYVLTTRASVSGLTKESSVRYRGLAVGKVDDIQFDPALPGQILVRITVERGTPITQSTFATLGYQGVTGLAYVQFDDDGTSKTLLETSPDHVARIEIRPGLFDKLSGNSEALMAQMNEIAARINTLVSPENQRLLTQSLVNLDATVTRFGQLAPKLEPTLDRLPGVMNDTQRALVSFNGMASDFSRVAGSYDSIASRVQGKGGMLEKVDGSLARFDRTAGSLDGLAEHVANETVPQVDQFVQSSSRSIRALGRVADDLSDHPQSLLFGDPRIPPGPGEPGYSVNP